MESRAAQQLVYKNSVDSAKCNQLIKTSKIPYFYLYSNHLVIYPQFERSTRKAKVSQKSLDNLKKEKRTGKISEASVRSINQRVTSWLKSILVFNDQLENKYKSKKYYPVFVTLTLSSKQQHEDNWIKREMLGQFVKKIQRSYGVQNYFWRAEKQKNGNIHFHLLIDKYISYKNLLKDWNHTQEIKGYLDSFKIRFKGKVPNSVDVRSANTVDNFINYVLKYMVKNDGKNKVNGRIWGMSEKIKKLKTYRDVITGKMNELIDTALVKDQIRFYKGEYFTCIYFKEDYINSSLQKYLDMKAKSFYLDVFGEVYENQPMRVEEIPEPPKEIEIPKEQMKLDLEFDTRLPQHYQKNTGNLIN